MHVRVKVVQFVDAKIRGAAVTAETKPRSTTAVRPCVLRGGTVPTDHAAATAGPAM